MSFPRMIGGVSRAWLLAAVFVLALPALPAGAQGFGGALDVALSVGSDGAGLEAGRVFRVTARLSDPATGLPVENAHLAGWIRPVDEGNVSCADAARSYFVNQGALPRGSTDLSRSLYGVLHDDDRLAVVDWEHALASANIRAITGLPKGARDIVALTEGYSFAVRAADGAIWRVAAAEGTEAERLPSEVTEVTSNGWLRRRDALVSPAGDDFGLPDGVKLLRPTLPDPDDGRDRGVLALAADRAMLYRPDAAPQAFVAPSAASDVGYSDAARAAIFTDGSATLTLVFEGGVSIAAPLAAAAKRISVDPEGQFAIAWSPGSPVVSIVEISTASVVQGIALNRAPVDQPLREVAFAGTAAFLLLEKLDFVMVVDLEQARRGAVAAVRPVRLGPAVEDLPAGAGPFLVASQRGHDAGAVLALHPDLMTAFPVSQDSGNTTAPMNGFRIRGARPLGLAELNAALKETAPGLHSAATVLPRGGRYEVIVSGGPGNFTSCAQFEVEGETQSTLALRLRAIMRDGAVLLSIEDEDGQTQRWPGALPVRMLALENGWRGSAVTKPRGATLHSVDADDLPGGQVSIALDVVLPAGVSVAPATLEVRR